MESFSDTKRLWSIASAAFFLLSLTGCPEPGPEEDDQDQGSNNTGAPDMGMDPDQGGENNTTNMTTPTGLRISSVTPALGSVAGGTEVTIDGGGFAPGSRVYFGGVEATSAEVRSPTQIVASSPANQTPGVVDVEVELPGGEKVSKAGAFTYTEGVVETEFFCQLQAQSPVQAIVGAPSPELYAVVYAKDITQGDGAGAGITGEVGYGAPGTAHEDFTFTAMTYNVDKDGLTPGDRANDEYGGALSLDATGEYRYVARFERESAPGEWIYCDLDGSENGIAADQLGVISVGEAQRPQISFCQLQAQSPAMFTTGEEGPALYAVVFAEGLTQGEGQGGLIEGELGYGPDASNYESFTYTAMAYNTDKDGVNAGDRSNDEYGAALTIDMDGSYRYTARFRTTGPESEWFYCDLDGNGPDDPFEPEEIGVIDVATVQPPSISYCRTETATASSITNNATMNITGEVYLAGVTDVAGAGQGITSEIVWGPIATPPSMWQQTVAATYAEDSDGVNAGDMANDRYGATITASAPGDYGYYYRFSSDGGMTWTLCDTDGSGADPATFEDTKVGALSVADSNVPDDCKLQFPAVAHNAAAAPTGQELIFYGRVVELGVTDMSDGDPSIMSELRVGPTGADPVADLMMFDVIAGTLNTNPTGLGADEDEFQVGFTPAAAGAYKYFWRFSVDSGQTWSSCDLDGGAFEPEKVGVVWAEDAASPGDQIDYCRVWQSSVTKSLADPNEPIFTVEIYEDGVTPPAMESADLEVEIGYGALGTNPALPGAFTWTGLPYKAPLPSNANNDEYEGAPYAAGMPPAVGEYDVVVRTRRVGATHWVYCDNDETNMNYLPERAPRLEITP